MKNCDFETILYFPDYYTVVQNFNVIGFYAPLKQTDVYKVNTAKTDFEF